MALRSPIETWLTLFLDSLPRGDRSDLRAGYAMAIAAVVAAVVFGIVVGIISGVGVGTLFFNVGEQTNPLVIGGVAVMAVVSSLTAAGASLAVVIPGGFVGGVVVWRFVPKSLRFGGLLGGLLSTLVGYVVSCALVFPLGIAYSIIIDPSVATVTDSVVTLAPLLGFIGLFTSWASVPVGILTGYFFERSLDSHGESNTLSLTG